MPRPTHAERDTKLISEVLKHFDDAESGSVSVDNRKNMADDLRFCYEPGAQWEPTTLLRRSGRPNYSYNRTVQSVNQVVGDQRQARITGRVRAVNKDASKETADIYAGLIRNIEACSGAQYIYSDQFKFAVAGGWGAWRICPDFVDDEGFDQELYIRGVPNPMTVYWDPAATCPCKSDSQWCVVAERVNKEAFEAEWPDASLSSIQLPRDSRDWFTSDEIRIAEYWKRIGKKKRIARLSDGRIVEYTPELRRIEEQLEQMSQGGIPIPTIEKERTTVVWTVKWWKVTAADVLEGPEEYNWKRIPVIRIPGRYINIEGQEYVQSMIRHAKDAQRTYNYNRSTMVESVALTPKAPYKLTPKMITGYEDQWNTANAINRPYLLYNVDPASPTQMPMREQPPDVPQALIALAAADAEDIKQTTGQVNPSVPTDQMSADESGVALRTRLLSGGSNAYEFTDNLQRAVQITQEMLIDMIPTVYDTERVVRIVGEDEVEDYVTVNGVDEKKGIMVVLAKGAYDVTVTIGPAYATARQENIDKLMEATAALPVIQEVGADIIVKNLDIEDGDELRKRIRKKYIAAGLIQPTDEEAEEMGPPPPPDPAQTALVERLQAQTARDSATAQKTQAEVQMLPLEMEERVAQIVNTRLESLLKAGELSQVGGQTVKAERQKVIDAEPAT